MAVWVNVLGETKPMDLQAVSTIAEKAITCEGMRVELKRFSGILDPWGGNPESPKLQNRHMYGVAAASDSATPLFWRGMLHPRKRRRRSPKASSAELTGEVYLGDKRIFGAQPALGDNFKGLYTIIDSHKIKLPTWVVTYSFFAEKKYRGFVRAREIHSRSREFAERSCRH